jgi:hypothetical protein
MKEIPLTQGKSTLVDDGDYESLIKYKWFAQKSGTRYYAGRNVWGGTRKRPKISYVFMHRCLLDTPKGMEVDHIDGNGLNNQKSNLRNVTKRENLQNRHTPKTSRFPGVSWQKSTKMWVSQIRIGKGGKQTKHLGRFTNEEDAYKAYCNELELIGYVGLSESQTHNIITALDYYMHNLDDAFKPELIEIRRKLHTALTIAKVNQIDEEE